ncbi:uncharacterized protein LOC124809067 [Hydra vulgaris]|uniref:uncharacterized protein LOC124809067 n=1 Tax=Hydra vulgaris TaxID=6087 RepID=UPI0032EA5B40
MGKFVNDSSPSYSNCFVKIVSERNVPHLCFFSTKDIPKFTELRYSYGETSGLSWRKQSIYKRPLILTNMDNFVRTLDTENRILDNIDHCNVKTTNCGKQQLSNDNQSVSIIIQSKSPAQNIYSSILLSENIDLINENVQTCEKSVPQTSLTSLYSNVNESESSTSDIISQSPVLLTENIGYIFEKVQSSEKSIFVTSVQSNNLDAENHISDNIDHCNIKITNCGKQQLSNDNQSVSMMIKSESPVQNIYSSILLAENIDFVIENVQTCEKSTLETSVPSMNPECSDGNSIPGYVKCKMEKGLALNNIDMVEEALTSWKNESAKKLIKDSLDHNQKLKRRKVKCPKCDRPIVNLKRHMMSVHELDKAQAKAARVNFGLNITKKSVSESYKKRKYVRRQCPMFSCALAPKRLENHLKQYHKLDKERVKRYLLKACPLLEDFPDEDEKIVSERLRNNLSSPDSDLSLSETSDSESFTDSEAKAKQEWFFTSEISRKGADFLNSSEDEDWLAQEYMKRRGILPVKDSTSESESDDQSDKDFEDIEQPFILSSLEEDIFRRLLLVVQ